MRVGVYSNTASRLWSYIEALDVEVGGFGYAFLDDDESLGWTDVFLVPQTVSGSEVDFDADGLASAVEKAASDGVLGQEGFVWVSWHSHHSMKAFWSSTDERCIRTYGEAGIPALLSFVGNHQHEYKLRLDLFGVQHGGIAVPQVTIGDLRLEHHAEDRLASEIAAEIKANVTRRKKVKQQSLPGARLERALQTWDGDDNGYIVGPDGLGYLGFDSMAWEEWE